MEPVMNHPLSNAKAALRKEMLRKRSTLDRKEVEKISALLSLRLRDFIRSTAGENRTEPLTVMSYMSHKNEFPTIDLNREILQLGWRLALPYTDRSFEISACIVDSLDHLHLSSMGILEPDPSVSVQIEAPDADLILLPGVAFDLQGRRLGYGKGCYDRFLTRTDGLRPVTAALAWSFQIVGRIPAEKHDIPCDYLITEKKIIKTSL